MWNKSVDCSMQFEEYSGWDMPEGVLEINFINIDNEFHSNDSYHSNSHMQQDVIMRTV